MKLYGNNRQLAEQLLETAFALLRNEGLQPANCLALVWGQLAGGIDVSPSQLHDQGALRREAGLPGEGGRDHSRCLQHNCRIDRARF